ncbi:hypothetical protein D4N05_21860, partial [Klebsiella oxytoca]
ESVYTATYRGFESPPHRHILRRARTQVRAFFSPIARHRGDEKPRRAEIESRRGHFMTALTPAHRPSLHRSAKEQPRLTI